MARLRCGRSGKLVIVAAVTLLPLLVLGFSNGPNDGLTGAPGEGLCTNCHSGNPVNGSVEITGAPVAYKLGETYTITVTVQDPGQTRWGFELTAKDTANDGAGTFTITDATNTQLSDQPAPNADYVKHTSLGTYAGTAGPATWQFDWTSPSSNVGDITFYAAGNAANNNGSSSGDNIYSTSFTSEPYELPSSSQIGLLVIVALLILTSTLYLRHRKPAQRVAP
jgi:hypothetical protein